MKASPALGANNDRVKIHWLFRFFHLKMKTLNLDDVRRNWMLSCLRVGCMAEYYARFIAMLANKNKTEVHHETGEFVSRLIWELSFRLCYVLLRVAQYPFVHLKSIVSKHPRRNLPRPSSPNRTSLRVTLPAHFIHYPIANSTLRIYRFSARTRTNFLLIYKRDYR